MAKKKATKKSAGRSTKKRAGTRKSASRSTAKKATRKTAARRTTATAQGAERQVQGRTARPVENRPGVVREHQAIDTRQAPPRGYSAACASLRAGRPPECPPSAIRPGSAREGS